MYLKILYDIINVNKHNHDTKTVVALEKNTIHLIIQLNNKYEYNV